MLDFAVRRGLEVKRIKKGQKKKDGAKIGEGFVAKSLVRRNVTVLFHGLLAVSDITIIILSLSCIIILS